MEGYLKEIIDYLLPMSDIILYAFLFISSVIENLFPPIPGDTITAFGAFLVGTGRLDFFYVFLSTTTGSVTGFMVLVYVGRYFGRRFLEDKNYKHFNRETIEKAGNWIDKYGYLVVLSNRFLPGIRSVISLASGISRLKILLISIYSLISASIWNLIWIYAGYVLGTNWDVVQEKIGSLLRQYNIIVGIIIILVIVAIYIIKKKK